VANKSSSRDQIARLVRKCLEEGQSVDIDGLGVFRGDGAGGYQFIAQAVPTIFLAYVEEDRCLADRLFGELEGQGFSPWLDRRKLLPGQNWPRAIEEAIETSDFFIACFSRRSVRKKGAFQSEIRYALDCARRIPLDEAFVIPVRLDECRVPWVIRRQLQYIDLFPDWNRGLRRIVGTIQRQMRRRLV
jgi:TIR domain-containing protein